MQSLKKFLVLTIIPIFLTTLIFSLIKTASPNPASAAIGPCILKISGTFQEGQPVNSNLSNLDGFTTYAIRLFREDPAGPDPLLGSKIHRTGATNTIPPGGIDSGWPGGFFVAGKTYYFTAVNQTTNNPCSVPPKFTIKSPPPPPPPEKCTLKAINFTGNILEPVQVIITNATPFTTYTFTLSKGDSPPIDSVPVGSGPIVDGGDVEHTFPGSKFLTPGAYVLSVAAPGNFVCAGFPFTIPIDLPSNPCTLKAINFTGHTGEPVEVVITNATPFTTYTFTVSKDGNIIDIVAVGSGPIVDGGDVIHTFPGGDFITAGSYVIFVAAPFDFACSGFPFTITISPPTVPGKNPCEGGICKTALGDIVPTIGAFAQKILNIGIGLAGGIALILMVIGAIRILTSSGDPQKVASGREIIVGALVGLLFLVLSVIILRFIGVSVIGIPGFG